MGKRIEFPQTGALKTTQIKLEDFLGVDYSDNVKTLQRAADMKNMVRENEILQMRHPIKYENATSFSGKINGIYEWHILKTNLDCVVIHSGTDILVIIKTATLQTDTPIIFEDVVTDNESMATVLDNKLVIFDGNKPYLLYQDDTQENGINHCLLYDYADLYAPTTSISRSPNGSSNVWYEAPNRINDNRKNLFTTIANSSSVAASLVLDDIINVATNTKFKVEQMNYLGQFIDVTNKASIIGPNTIDIQYSMNTNPIYNNIIDTTDNYIYLDLNRLVQIKTSADVDVPFTFDKTNYQIILTTPVANSVNINQYKYYFTLEGVTTNYTLSNISAIYNTDGSMITGIKFKDIGLPPIRENDNIKVTFAVDMAPYRKEIDTIGIITKYGYQANMNRIFGGGNTTNPNTVLWCAANNPTYWPEDHYSKCGESAVIGFTTTRDGSLVIHKKKQTDNITAYYMGSDLAVLVDKYERTVEIFPIISAVGDFELVNKYMTDTYLNDPCFLTNNGLYMITNGTMTNNKDERFSEERSYYIKQAVPAFIKNNPKRLIQFNKYLFMFNESSFYIIDKSNVSYSPERVQQYEWYPCDSVLFKYDEKLLENHKITSVNVCWNTLYIGDNLGVLYKYDVDSLDFYDGDYRYSESTRILPINSEWLSQPINGGIIDYTKTLTDIFINYLPFSYHNKFKVNIVTRDENKNVFEEWYNVEDNPGIPYVEDFAEYDFNRRDWSGEMAFRYNSSRTFRIRQRTNNFDECQIHLKNISFEDTQITTKLRTYTTHMSLRNITLDMILSRRVR